VSYTLRGRLESRLAAALGPAVVAGVLALALQRWWPVELAALMAAVGLVLDVVLYDRVLDYQPGWLALPMGVLELGIVTGLAIVLGVRAPLGEAIAFFCGAWALALLLGQAVYPLARASYGDDGGELGRAGAAAAVGLVVLFAAAGGTAWATQPPTVTLGAGVHQGPIVLDHSQKLVGRPGAVVRGGIVVRASDVTIRGVSVVGGKHGIDVQDARRVVLDRVSVSGAGEDGIHVRHAQVSIRDCTVDSGANEWAQGIDISFAYDLPMSEVSDCTVTGGREGIVTHSVQVMLMGNRVRGTTLRGIAMTEMSMAMAEHNDVHGALGVGIYCGDRSMCEVDDNVVTQTRPDHASSDVTRDGYAIVSWWDSELELGDNTLLGNRHDGAAAFANATIERDG
jgi:nitrous oxidase accessory protein NosD